MRTTPLPPSMEKAYHKKCVELRRRLTEIEDANDEARLRKRRLARSILKMRLERAFLLDKLAKSQQLTTLDESDRSSSPHNMLFERRPRPKHPPLKSPSLPEPPGSAAPPSSILQDAQKTFAKQYASKGVISSLASPGNLPSHSHRSSARLDNIDRRAPSEVPAGESLPLITRLPNGTNVIIMKDGQPKQAPWTIHDIEPRHHLDAGFESMPRHLQDELIDKRGYSPFDLRGNPVNLRVDSTTNKFRHIFKGEADWVDPMNDKGDRSNDIFREDVNNGRTRREELHMRRDAGAIFPRNSRPESEGVAQDRGRDSSLSTAATGQGGFTAVNR